MGSGEEAGFARPGQNRRCRTCHSANNLAKFDWCRGIGGGFIPSSTFPTPTLNTSLPPNHFGPLVPARRPPVGKKEVEQLLRALAPPETHKRPHGAQLIGGVIVPQCPAIPPMRRTLASSARTLSAADPAANGPALRLGRERSSSRWHRNRPARRSPASMRCRALLCSRQAKHIYHAETRHAAAPGESPPPDGRALWRWQLPLCTPSRPRNRPSTSASVSPHSPRG